ncbi:threonine ammonia-lyase [Pseudactinotalea terrae]|uniref:threonine ammonia-lyase n=1 Tax=Pseudactinotalea terrae TaxID=1743262 RepID=UPI001F4F56DF|nr:threonine ammonia-lyase [Pseudactinotalea terrae]
MAADLRIEHVRAAAATLADVISRTPVEESAALSRIAGTRVVLKCENLQRGGSFKIRGAYLRMSRLTQEQQARGVVAASAGNHAQGVALAAAALGIDAVVYMPLGAALPKIAATKGYGATVRMHGSTVDEALVEAYAEAERTGRTLIHPFDHLDIVTGQATLGLEIAEQVPDVRTVIVPTGGGGLLAGVSTALHGALGPHVTIVGVQAEGAAAYPDSLAQGRPVALAQMQTMADGIAIGCPGEVPLDIVAREVQWVETVSEEELSQALLLLTERAKLVVEPSGAAGVAALRHHPGRWEGPVVVVLSGGNVDPLVLMRVLQHGLVAAGRYLQVKVRTKDTPGHLARLLAELAAQGGNVLNVGHVRTDPTLAVDEVDIAVEIETRGAEHCTEVIERLHAAGYQVLPG